MTKQETAQLMAMMAVAYPRFETNELKKRLWCELLADIPMTLAATGLKTLMRQMIYPPTPAEIITQARLVALCKKPASPQLVALPPLVEEDDCHDK